MNIKYFINRFSILTIAIIGISTSTACTSSKSSNYSNEPASTGAAQKSETQSIENKPENAKETLKEKPEPSSEKSVEPDVLGKYECCEVGVEGTYSLTLKANNIASYKQMNEDSDGTGSGSWNWDKNKEFINVNLTVKSEFTDGESLETKTSTEKISFKLKKDDKNLKIVEETLSPKELDGYFIGKTFKKL